VIVAKSDLALEVPYHKVGDEVQTDIIILFTQDWLRIARPIVLKLE